MTEKWVTLKTYGSRPEAEVAKSLLNSNGIPAQIRSDDLAGLRPQLSLTSGVELKVTTAKFSAAKKILGDG